MVNHQRPLVEWQTAQEPGFYYVYHLLDNDDHVVYVGMTNHPVGRLSRHKRDKAEVSRMIVVDAFDSVYDCALKEFDEIERLAPSLNGGSFREAHARNVVRQQNGISAAKKAGTYKEFGGRPFTLTNEQISEALIQIASGKTKTEVAKELGVSRQTLYAALIRFERR